jgi:ADP-ribosylglycohydrolase
MEPEEIEGASFDKMNGYGTHHQSPGTFSDDSSLTFCLVESLIENAGPGGSVQQFLKWKNEGFWTATGEVFDIGEQTQKALNNAEKGLPLTEMAPSDEWSNGNGALMRILPLTFYAKDRTLDELYDLVQSYASVTHGHIRSHMACLILVKFASELLDIPNDTSMQKKHCFARVMVAIEKYFQSHDKFKNELVHFERLFTHYPDRLPSIENSGYVIHSLEAALHSFMRYNRYEMIIIQAIKHGGDTDTNAAIAGGLAGITYGARTIPPNWLNELARKEDIENLAERWALSYSDEI